MPENTGPSKHGRPTVVSSADVRRAGLLAAIGLGLLIALGLTVTMIIRRSAVSAGGGTRAATATGPATTTPAAEPPSDLPATLGAGSSDVGRDTPLASGVSDGFRAGKSRIAFLDQADPGRTSAVMSWQDLRPTGQGNSAVTEPRGLMFMRDGGVALITASRGTFFTPQGKTEPEAGRFEGGVTLELFDALPGRAVDLVADSPSLVATTQTLLFEATESTVSTPDRFVAESAGFAVEGVGSRVVFDQVGQGVARAEFNKVDQVRIWPNGRPGLVRPDGTRVAADGASGSNRGPTLRSAAQEARASEARGAGDKPSLRDGPSGPPATGVAAVRRIYRVVVEDDVVVRQGVAESTATGGTGGTGNAGESRVTLSASRAEAWLTTENNRMVAGAVAPLDAGLLPLGSRSATPKAVDGASGGAGGASNVDEPPIVATWAGRMIITPVVSVPEAFGGGLAALRLTGGAAGPARVVDRGANGSGTVAVAAPIIEYGATTRVLELTGTRASNVVLDAPSLGLLTCTKARIDAENGRFEVQGAGELTALTAPGAGAGRSPASGGAGEGDESLLVTWSESLTLSAPGLVGQRRLQRIEARGTVRAQTGELVAQAERGVVSLGEGDAGGRPRIESVELAGNASATTRGARGVLQGLGAEGGAAPNAGGGVGAGEPDRLSGDRLLVTLSRDERGRDRPRRVEVSGAAVASGGGLRVSAPLIEASLGEGVGGRVSVTAARAQGAGGQAVVTGEGGLQAFADTVEADPVLQTAVLRGTPARLQRQGAELVAAVVALDQQQQVVTIDGAGTLNAVSQEFGAADGREAGARPVRVSAGWGTSARMDNRAGTIEARGATRVTIAAGDDELNTIKGERLELTLSGGDTGGAGAAGAGGERRVRGVRVVAGAGPDGVTPDASGATVEHRRFVASALGGGVGERRVSRLVFLQGADVRADVEAGWLEVPGAGKLLVDQPGDRGLGSGGADARGGVAGGAAGALGSALEPSRGTSLFSWSGSLRMERSSGRLTMRQGVQLTHRPADAQGRLTLDCAELDAELTERSGAAGASLAGVSADLRRVEARGSAGDEVRASEISGAPDGNGGATPTARELTALTLIYDAAGGVMRAVGSDESLAVFVDGAQPTPVRATEIEWDLRQGRLSARGLAPITIAPMR